MKTRRKYLDLKDYDHPIISKLLDEKNVYDYETVKKGIFPNPGTIVHSGQFSEVSITQKPLSLPPFTHVSPLKKLKFLEKEEGEDEKVNFDGFSTPKKTNENDTKKEESQMDYLFLMNSPNNQCAWKNQRIKDTTSIHDQALHEILIHKALVPIYRFSPGIAKLLGWFKSKHGETTSMNCILERADTTFGKFLKEKNGVLTGKLYKSIWFQMLFNLLILQRMVNFNHRDLHNDNILLKNLDKGIVLTFKVDRYNHRWYVDETLVLITDFGHSRLEVKQEEKGKKEIVLYNKSLPSSFAFDPKVDVMKIVDNFRLIKKIVFEDGKDRALRNDFLDQLKDIKDTCDIKGLILHPFFNSLKRSNIQAFLSKNVTFRFAEPRNNFDITRFQRPRVKKRRKKKKVAIRRPTRSRGRNRSRGRGRRRGRSRGRAITNFFRKENIDKENIKGKQRKKREVNNLKSWSSFKDLTGVKRKLYYRRGDSTDERESKKRKVDSEKPNAQNDPVFQPPSFPTSISITIPNQDQKQKILESQTVRPPRRVGGRIVGIPSTPMISSPPSSVLPSSISQKNVQIEVEKDLTKELSVFEENNKILPLIEEFPKPTIKSEKIENEMEILIPQDYSELHSSPPTLFFQSDNMSSSNEIKPPAFYLTSSDEKQIQKEDRSGDFVPEDEEDSDEDYTNNMLF